MQDTFQVCVKYAFNAAHFIAHEEERETLHGHNYRLKVYLQECEKIDPKTGYVMDFDRVEKVAIETVKTIKSKLIVPMLSETLEIKDAEEEDHILIRHGKSKFMLPKQDCALIDVKFPSAEEVSRWICDNILKKLDPKELNKLGVKSIKIELRETDKYKATYIRKLE